MPPIGLHSQNSRIKARLDSNVYVLRSADSGMIRVHTRLNAGRAITLCCSANSASRPRSISTAAPTLVPRAESMALGTHRLPMKPMAYRNVAKNTA